MGLGDGVLARWRERGRKTRSRDQRVLAFGGDIHYSWPGLRIFDVEDFRLLLRFELEGVQVFLENGNKMCLVQ